MWNKHFDKLVCINLVNRTDKRDYVKKVFRTMQVQVDFFDAQKHPKGGRYGCFHSHISVISEAYNNGYERLVVFEDDIMLSPSYQNDLLLEVFAFLSDSGQKWDYFQFGYFPVVDEAGRVIPYSMAKQVKGYPHIFEFIGLGAHAYCLNRDGMRKILSSSWKDHIDDMHFDIYVTKIKQLKGYCVAPLLFEQKFCLGSDNIARTPQEYIGRKFSCLADKTHLLHWVSLFKYTFCTYQIAIWSFCLLLASLVVIITMTKHLLK